MPNYFAYTPEQAELLPRHVRDELPPGHLCFLIHQLIEAMDLIRFDEAYSEEGQKAYNPRLMIKVWLYAFALRVKSTRKLEQRIGEDLGFRFLAGGRAPDHKTLSEFLRLHGKAIVALFTQVLQLLRRAGVARLGEVAIDSTRIKGNASRERVVRRSQLEEQVRQWMQELDEDPDRQPGRAVSVDERQRVQEQLRQLRESGESRLSLTDGEARFLRERQGFVLGYTGEIAVSQDHFIVAQRVTQNQNDNGSLLPMVDEVERQCRASSATSAGRQRIFQPGERGSTRGARHRWRYVPDSNLARELNLMG